MLVILSGDVEPNPSLAATTTTTAAATAVAAATSARRNSQPKLCVGCSNARSFVNLDTSLVTSAIDVYLDVLAMTETWKRAEHQMVIKCDLAPTGFTLSHVHRAADNIGFGVAVIPCESLCARPFGLSVKYCLFEVSTKHFTINTGRVNLITAVARILRRIPEFSRRGHSAAGRYVRPCQHELSFIKREQR